jgi:hypothetical protein
MVLNTNIGPERVQVFPQALGNVSVPGASLSGGYMLISTSLAGAPENAPTAVANLDQFEASFGGPDEVANFAYYAAQGFFDNGGSQLVVVNVGAAATAADYVGSAASGTGLRAFDALDEVGLLMAPGLSLADAFLVQPALINYAEVIRAEFGATLSTTFSLCTVPKEILSSNQEAEVTTAQLNSISGTGPFVLDVQVLSGAVAASGTLTVVDFNLLAGAVATVDGVAYTEGVEWTAAVDNDTTAASLAECHVLFFLPDFLDFFQYPLLSLRQLSSPGKYLLPSRPLLKPLMHTR